MIITICCNKSCVNVASLSKPKVTRTQACDTMTAHLITRAVRGEHIWRGDSGQRENSRPGWCGAVGLEVLLCCSDGAQF